jgi:hypothetical protein
MACNRDIFTLFLLFTRGTGVCVRLFCVYVVLTISRNINQSAVHTDQQVAGEDLLYPNFCEIFKPIFSSPARPNKPPIQWVLMVLSPGVKLPVREADQPPPSSTEVKKGEAIPSLPTYVFMAWCLVN